MTAPAWLSCKDTDEARRRADEVSKRYPKAVVATEGRLVSVVLSNDDPEDAWAALVAVALLEE